MINNLFNRLLSGETINAVNPENGVQFSVSHSGTNKYGDNLINVSDGNGTEVGLLTEGTVANWNIEERTLTWN